MEELNDTITLHTPEGMAYTCHNEGVCCNVFDTIPLDEPAAAALSTLDTTQLNARAANPPSAPVTAINPAAPPAEKLARKACGSCTMLTPDNLCAIHALAGEAAKPRVCQDFPWRYVETPDGVYVGLSFVCPSVRANRGQLVSDQAHSLTSRYQSSASIRKAPTVVPLNGRTTLPWSEYMQLEGALLDLLSMEAEPLTVRIIACCMLPGFIDQVLVSERKTAPTTPPSTVIEIITAMRRSSYSHLLRVARKPTPPAARSRRMFLGMFTSFANTLHQRGRGRLITVAGVMSQYVRHAAGIGTVSLQPISARLSHADLDSALLPDSGYPADQVARYLHHCIWRKDLTLTGDFTRRIRLLALNAALIPWYAKAIATDAGRPSPTNSDWDEAIGNVERLYGFHSAFYRFFEQNKAFSDIVDSFILKPSYPFALFR